jgi:hypothetical protein
MFSIITHRNQTLVSDIDVIGKSKDILNRINEKYEQGIMTKLSIGE